MYVCDRAEVSTAAPKTAWGAQPMLQPNTTNMVSALSCSQALHLAQSRAAALEVRGSSPPELQAAVYMHCRAHAAMVSI